LVSNYLFIKWVVEHLPASKLILKIAAINIWLHLSKNLLLKKRRSKFRTSIMETCQITMQSQPHSRGNSMISSKILGKKRKFLKRKLIISHIINKRLKDRLND
jgi:hypothetical protein